VKELTTKLSRDQETHFKNFVEFFIFYFWKDIEDNPLYLSLWKSFIGMLKRVRTHRNGRYKNPCSTWDSAWRLLLFTLTIFFF